MGKSIIDAYSSNHYNKIIMLVSTLQDKNSQPSHHQGKGEVSQSISMMPILIHTVTPQVHYCHLTTLQGKGQRGGGGERGRES